jgi:hypothetical protein
VIAVAHQRFLRSAVKQRAVVAMLARAAVNIPLGLLLAASAAWLVWRLHGYRFGGFFAAAGLWWRHTHFASLVEFTG